MVTDILTDTDRSCCMYAFLGNCEEQLPLGQIADSWPTDYQQSANRLPTVSRLSVRGAVLHNYPFLFSVPFNLKS